MQRIFLLLLSVAFITLRGEAQGTLRFVENKGQWPEGVTHRGELNGATLWFERGALVIDRYDAEAMANVHADIRAVLPIAVQHHLSLIHISEPTRPY